MIVLSALSFSKHGSTHRLPTCGTPSETAAELQRALDETVTRLVEGPAPVAL